MVHIHAEGPAFFCWIPKLFGKRVICTIHGLDWAREKWKFGVGSKFIRQGEKSAVKYADEIIVLSKGVQKYFMETYGNIFKLMNCNRECRYKVLGRVANSDQGLCMLFDLEEAIMFTPKPQEYTDPLTGEMKKKQIKFFPDVYKDRIGKSYNDYISGHQMNLFEDFIGYQGSAVLDEPEQKTDTISVPIPQCEESENIPLPDLSEQPENVQRPGSEVVEKGMLT